MPPAEVLTLPRTEIRGWGGGGSARVSLMAPDCIDALRAIVTARSGPALTGAIARGQGRSYGDAAQLDGGLVLDMTHLKRLELNPEQGTVTAQAGVTIGELLSELVPRGWMVPVVPGTQHVTVGGAIASDIHGKNHGTVGTFGRHVRALGLMTAAGELLELRPGSDPLFEATIGGMGLTGVIVWAQIALRAVPGPLLSVDTDRAADLDDALALLLAPGGSHRVAWLDLLGSPPGRGVVTRAEHVEGAAAAARTTVGARATVRARATVPARWPAGILRASTVAAFNELRLRRAPRRERGRIEALGRHMFPLDGLERWPRLYGGSGLLQYQLVVPVREDPVLRAVIEQLRDARVPCFLAVLKDFGPANAAPLSFPIAGWTLALDVPRGAGSVWSALRRCDELVAAAGGRVYLTKDARLGADAVAAMYPRLGEWRAVRDRADPDGVWRSDLARRTGLVAA